MKAGWELKKLGDVLQKTETVNPLQLPNTEFYYVDVSSVSNETFQIESTQQLIGNDAPSRARRLIKTNDILFATVRPTLQRIAIVPEYLNNQVCSTGYFVLRPKNEMDYRFVFYFLFSKVFMEQMEALQKGASYPAVTDGEVRSQIIPLPPLPEQQRIVAILDKAFENIAIAKANAEQNLKNARELFESYLQSVFTQKSEGWTEKTLGEMATFRNGINFTKSSKGESIKILGVKDFKNYYWAPLEDFESVIPDGNLPDLDLLKQNDLVFVRSNGNPELIGRCLLVGEVKEKITHSGFTIRARLNSLELEPNYLCHFLKSNKVRREMIDGGNGASIRSLNQGTLSGLVIPFPVSLKEQALIVKQLELIQEKTQHLESIYQQKIAALDELKKSLLHKAFNGEL